MPATTPYFLFFDVFLQNEMSFSKWWPIFSIQRPFFKIPIQCILFSIPLMKTFQFLLSDGEFYLQIIGFYVFSRFVYRQHQNAKKNRLLAPPLWRMITVNINMKRLLIKKMISRLTLTLTFSYRALILNGMFCSNTWRLDIQIILVEHC